MGQQPSPFLSTDPAAGLAKPAQPSPFLSTDPSAGFAPAPDQVTQAQWDALSFKEKAQHLATWAGNAIGSTFLGSSGPALVTSAKEHPIATGISLAAGPAIAEGTAAAAPYVSPAVSAAANFLQHPVVGAVVGGSGEAMSGGSPLDIAKGALYGSVGSTLLGQTLNKWQALRAAREANAGGRVVPRSTPTVEEALVQALKDQMDLTPVQLEASHPIGGGYTVPTTPNPNAGGRVVAGSERATTPINAAITDALMAARTPAPTAVSVAPSAPAGGGYTVPPSSDAVPVPAAAPVASTPATPTPPVAEVAPQSVSISPSAPKWSPQQIRNEVGLAERRAKLTLTDEQRVMADQMVAQGTPPMSAVQQLARSAAAAKQTLNAVEVRAYQQLRATGASHQEAVDAINAQRALIEKLGTPSLDNVKALVAQRNATGRWPQQ